MIFVRLTAVAVVALALVLSSCGGGHKRTIPTKDAQAFLQQLDKIQSQFDNGACVGASAKVSALASQVRQLPSSVDSEVKQNLISGVARLQTLVSRQCQRPTPTNTATTPTITQTVPTVTQTVPTQTQTVPTPTQTVPTTTTPPPTGTTPPGGGGGVTVPGTTTPSGGVGGGTP
jgi:hypothetical protein